jgi:hypothetical protein
MSRPNVTGWPLLHPCGNPACIRTIAGSARYCCAGCATAHEGRYDPEGYHSTGCDDRARERGTLRPWEVHPHSGPPPAGRGAPTARDS